MKKIIFGLTIIVLLIVNQTTTHAYSQAYNSPQPQSDRQTIQIQLNLLFIGGYLMDQQLSDITADYGNQVRDQFNTLAPTANFANDSESASWAYGIAGEPRLFLGLLGAGLNAFYLSSQQTESTIQSRTYTGEADVMAKMTSYGVLPMIYLRPIFNSGRYLILGGGMGVFKNKIKTDYENLTTPSLTASVNEFNYNYEGEGRCYKVAIEIGYITGENLFYNVGVSYMQMKVQEYKTSYNEALKYPDGNNFKGGMSGVYLYFGVGAYY